MRVLGLNLLRDESGATIVEFALIAPVLAVTLMGLFDFSYNFYAESMIEGSIQKAARDSTIERYAQNPAVLDSRVRSAVQKVVPSSTVTMKRTAYSNYRDVGKPEKWTDGNSDGTCNNNEVFVDANGNGTWDRSGGLSASTGARDAVLYEVNATYNRKFPLAPMLGFEPTVTVTARTVLRNQPFNQQEAPATGNCA